MRLRSLHEDKIDKDFFDYSSVSDVMWDEKFKEAKEEFNVEFNLENDEATTQRTITIPQKTWEHSKCRFRCEMRYAGGDWEAPSVYFRCQLVDGYADGISKYGDPHFVVIPDGDNGNEHHSRSDKGTWVAPDNESDASRPNEKECWRYLNAYLEDMVKREEQNVKDGKI